MSVVKIDGIGLNAEHFAAMNEKEAVAKMKADNILSTYSKDEEWAKGAYAQCVLKVKGPVAKPKEVKKNEKTVLE